MFRVKKGVDPRRSKNMRAVRSQGNKTTELRLRAVLVQAAVSGWMLCPDHIPGRPDFLFPGARVVVFVDGCFWHGCPSCGHLPHTNKAYWAAKLTRNKRRDRLVTKLLRSLGYRVIRIWECRLRANPKGCLSRVITNLTSAA